MALIDFFLLQIDTHIFEPQGIGFLETDCTFMTNELDNALTKVQDETKVYYTIHGTKLLMPLKHPLLASYMSLTYFASVPIFQAHIVFKPTITQQQKRPDLQQTLLDGDFLIRYDVKRSVKAGDIQVKKMTRGP